LPLPAIQPKVLPNGPALPLKLQAESDCGEEDDHTTKLDPISSDHACGVPSKKQGDYKVCKARKRKENLLQAISISACGDGTQKKFEAPNAER